MAKALSLSDKYEIQRLMKEDKSIAEIAKSLKTTQLKVKDFINNELVSLHDTINSVKNEKLEQKEKGGDVDKSLYRQAFDKLKVNVSGCSDGDINDALKRSIHNAKEENYIFKDWRDLYDHAIKLIVSKHLINKKTKNGNSGISIMNREASMRFDESKKVKRPGASRSSKGAVYRQDGTVD